ncbi:coiled-coil domain-containing protein 63-like isoform X1 [Petromyzon marinus]|uniref:coiled-coil domain-containing protein 63-like isoform X1 n=1 Tax=Petromyzon marinus TaxID=7757 RepID=UPI003F72D602
MSTTLWKVNSACLIETQGGLRFTTVRVYDAHIIPPRIYLRRRNLIRDASSDKTPDTFEQSRSLSLRAETELRALRQRKRAMEGAHRSYARDSEVTISRQQQQIRQLELERENLKLALGVAAGRQSKDRATSTRLVSLLRRQEDTEALIAQEKARQQQIDRQIKTAVEELRKMQRPTDEEEDLPKKMQTLTSQVEKAEGKFSSLLTDIADSRKEIETMRWERDRFHKVLQKLQKAGFVRHTNVA